jgi:hypothetical protein
MSGITRAAQAAMRVWLRPRARAFARDLRAPAAAQRRTLGEILQRLAETEYGRAHGVRGDAGVAEFRARLPIVSYADLAPWMERQMTRLPALTPERVLFYERTSGSEGPVKHIPCTVSLRHSFTELFLLWVHDLLASGPRLETARAWISTSPAAFPRATTAAGVPIGIDTDLDYLGGWPRRALSPFLALPSGVARLVDPADYTYVAAVFLFAGEPEVVSVWNPSLLLVLLDALASHRDEVARDVRAGQVVRGGMAFRIARRPGPAALAALAHDPVEWREVLPALRLVSCWADGPAADGAAQLRRRLPGVMVQGKGLLATEAPMTVPLVLAGGCVPLVHEVYFEFLDDAGAVGGIEDLQPGQAYSVVITQRGGLHRYRIGDRIRVTHRYLGAPCLAFEGREGAVSDLVGEKLGEPFVEAALGRLSLDDCRFRSLVAVPANGGAAHYVLVVDGPAALPPELPQRLDAELMRAVRYAEARRLGQLGAPRVRVVPFAARHFLDGRAELGTRRGAVKPATLVREPDVVRRLLGI